MSIKGNQVVTKCYKFEYSLFKRCKEVTALLSSYLVSLRKIENMGAIVPVEQNFLALNIDSFRLIKINQQKA